MMYPERGEWDTSVTDNDADYANRLNAEGKAMRKRKGVVLAIQMFCVLLLILSEYLELCTAQLAYCFTVFSSPFLLLAFGEAVFLGKKGYRLAGVVLSTELLISLAFVGTMITGMKMGAVAFRGFGTLLFAYVLTVVLSIAVRMV